MDSYAFQLVLTIAIEVPIVFALAPRELRKRTLLDVPLVNLVTHALGWLALQYGGLSWLAVELLVTLAEFVVYARITRLPALRAAVAAVTANTCTAVLALAVIWRL